MLQSENNSGMQRQDRQYVSRQQKTWGKKDLNMGAVAQTQTVELHP